jgi:hypothetical protein
MWSRLLIIKLSDGCCSVSKIVEKLEKLWYVCITILQFESNIICSHYKYITDINVVTCTVNNVYCVLSEFSFYKVSIINSKNVFFCSDLICELTIMVWKNTLPYHKVLWIWKKVVNRIKFSTYQKFVTPWLPAINKFDYKINI